MKRKVALLLGIALVFGLSAGALAAGNGSGNGQGNAGASGYGSGKNGAKGTASPTLSEADGSESAQEETLSTEDQAVRDKVKARLRQAEQAGKKTHVTPEEKKQALAQLKGEAAQLRSLQREAAQLRVELNRTLKQLRQTIDGAQKGQKWQALRASVPQLEAIGQRVKDVREQYQQSEGALEFFAEAQEGQNLPAAVLAIQDSEVRVAARIDALKQVIEAAKVLMADLQAAPADPAAPGDQEALPDVTVPDEDSAETEASETEASESDTAAATN